MSTKLLVKSAMILGIIIVLGFIPGIPLGFIPVPIIIQNLGILLAGALLPKRYSFSVVLLFLVMVAAGLPLLSGGRGGFAIFLGPTVGYLIAYPLAAFFISLVKELTNGKWVPLIISVFVFGVFFIDILGAVGMTLTLNMPLSEALLANLAFIPGDCCKAVLTLVVYAALPEKIRQSTPYRMKPVG